MIYLTSNTNREARYNLRLEKGRNIPPKKRKPEEGELTVKYVNDITEVVWAKSLEGLLRRAKARAARSVTWLEDNGRVPSLGMTKLLIMGTESL